MPELPSLGFAVLRMTPSGTSPRHGADGGMHGKDGHTHRPLYGWLGDIP